MIMIIMKANPPKTPVFRIKKLILLSLAALLVLSICTDLILSNTVISVSNYLLESEKITEPVRLAVITDLHSKYFGEENSRLVEKIKDQKPDLILTTGDLIDKNADNDDNLAYLTHLISQLTDIAPVYSCIGNQERDNPHRKSLEKAMESEGAHLFNLNHETITINNNSICISGLTYYRSWDEEANAYLQEYIEEDKDSFTLFLCHHPEFYLWGIEQYPLDLMISGHTHGGMIRLPFIGAVYAPEQKRFPRYAGGFYEMEQGHLAVCKGLGSSPAYLPRFHNLPELMIIDLI